MPISITILESELQVISGIPDWINIVTNVPVNIFYTLDGTDPTTGSKLFVAPIKLPTNIGNVEFKYFASNGVEETPIFSKVYGTTYADGRRSHDRVINADIGYGNYPFGSGVTGPSGTYENAGGININDPNGEQIPDGYDGTATGTPSNYTNKPVYSYDLIFSQTDFLGQMGNGIGTVPAAVTIIQQRNNTPSLRSNAESPFFDPKAMVIYQDSRNDPYDSDVPKVNRPHFNLENDNLVRDGALKQVSVAQPPMGGALIQRYNPTDNTIQFSYWDSRTNRWIFSKVVYEPKNKDIGNYSQTLQSSSVNGSRYVFKWLPFRYRRLIT